MIKCHTIKCLVAVWIFVVIGEVPEIETEFVTHEIVIVAEGVML